MRLWPPQGMPCYFRRRRLTKLICESLLPKEGLGKGKEERPFCCEPSRKLKASGKAKKKDPSVANPPASYRSLSGGVPKSLEKVSKKSEKSGKSLEKCLFGTFSRLSADLFRIWGPEGPRDSCSSQEGSQPF